MTIDYEPPIIHRIHAEIDPPSIRDIESLPQDTEINYNHHLHMQDPCPDCGAYNMRPIDYLFLGCCPWCQSPYLKMYPIPV